MIAVSWVISESEYLIIVLAHFADIQNDGSILGHKGV
jgi:hypothetical protein